MIRLLTLLFVLTISSSVTAEQRMETRDSFCHFVINPANDDNETFSGDCLNTITVDNNGRASGYVSYSAKYSPAEVPVDANTTYTQDNTTDANGNAGTCVMVDSNGVTYVSNEWVSTYTVNTNGWAIQFFNKSMQKQRLVSDFNNDGVVDAHDRFIFEQIFPVHTVNYYMRCQNGVAQ